MSTKKVLAVLAVSSLAFAQPAAAATRSIDSLPSQGANSATVERAGSIDGEAENISRAWLILLVFLIVAALIAASTGSKSPG